MLIEYFDKILNPNQDSQLTLLLYLYFKQNLFVYSVLHYKNEVFIAKNIVNLCKYNL